MINIITRSMIAICFMFGLFGCRKNYIYSYKNIAYDAKHGVFAVKMYGNIEDKRDHGKRIRVVSEPYSLVIRYLSDHKDLRSVKLTNLRLTTSDGIRVFSEAMIEESVAGKEIDGRYFVGFSFRNLKIPYQDCHLFGSYEILDSSGIVLDEGELNVVLETDYSEETTNDLVDAAMGV